MKHEQFSDYFAAAQYAVAVFGDDASRYFPRLHQLSQFNTPQELRAVIDGWHFARTKSGKAPRPCKVAPGLWAPGSAWGDTIRIECRGGIIWTLQCSCGVVFQTSTNDTVPEDQRKCPSCRQAEVKPPSSKAIRRAETLSDWYAAYGKLVWSRVHKACRRRGITDRDFLREIHALVWAKVAEVADRYKGQGYKPSTWLVPVVDNVIRDHFRVARNRKRLAPMYPLIEGFDPAAPATKPEEALPAKAVRPKGASPHDGATNDRQAAWDTAQNGNGFHKPAPPKPKRNGNSPNRLIV